MINGIHLADGFFASLSNAELEPVLDRLMIDFMFMLSRRASNR